MERNDRGAVDQDSASCGFKNSSLREYLNPKPYLRKSKKRSEQQCFKNRDVFEKRNRMKEVNEVKNDSLTVCNKEFNALSSDEYAVKLEEGEVEGSKLADDKAQGNKLELLIESSSSKDLINDTETVNTELTENESKDCLTNETEKEMREETGEDFNNKKFVLRPRKLDSNQNSEEFSKAKKPRSVNKKVEKKCAINKVSEDVIKCEEILLVCETVRDKQLNVTSDSNAAGTEERVGDVSKSADNVPQIKAEPPDSTQTSVSSENDGSSCENMLLSKSPDDNSSKSKENSESDTRISSASENSVIKVSSKRKKRRRDLWTKKRKKNDGNHVKEGESNLLIGNEASFKWALNGNASLMINGNIDNERKCSEASDGSQWKKQKFGPPTQSLSALCAKPVLPVSGPTPHEGSRTILCLCTKKPNVYISGNNNTGDLYCQALDSIDRRIIGCCNPIPSQDVALFRASEKVSYQMMCEIHQQRLIRHNCCPRCGLFCTQGRYMMCRSYHHYHRLCGIENDSNLIVCPHCGDDTPPKAIIISIHSAKDPIFLPNQKPLRKEKSAKISISRGSVQEPEEKEEDPTFQFPASLFNVGDEISPSNGFSSNLHRDKLAHLLNIACRSFSKLCCSNRYTYRTLFNTSHSGDAEKLLKIIASGLNPNHVFEEHKRQTPLHIAAGSGHLSLVHILLQAKAEINAMDGEQNTPLTAAISAKHNDVVKYLVKCGADLLLKGEDGMTPLHIAAKSGNVGACFHLLNGTHLPARYIDSLDDGGWTPMVWASEFNHIEVVKFLISKGADSLIKDAEQNIALHWAAFGGSIDIVELYLNDGSDINAVNVHGDTPLHIAARQDKYSCVLLLLARGATSDIKNKSGELPRDCGESPESDIYKAITLNMEISNLLTRFKDSTPRIISNDISRGKERNQIQCVNAVDNEGEPKDYIYVSESCFTSKISVDRTINSLQSCKCQNNCGTETCNCATISLKCWYDNEGKLKPDFNYADPPMIFECNQACMCNRITCHNRVVQNGISCRFQLFRTEGKGWGIKTLNLIPKGTYVCEYVGEIISDCEADHREDDSYLFDLDNRDGETYCIDARYYGNFARFINHMCVPNLMPVHVFVDHQDLRFPRIAFFAKTDISPGEELGYNYGEKFWVIKWKSFTCTCGAEKCMYSETTIQTTLENYKKKLMDENP